MTTFPKALLTATVVAAVGVGIYEAIQASRLRAQIQNLQEQQTRQIQQLQRERDDLARQLAALREENQRLARNTAELLKLRGEVSRLRREVNAAAPGRPDNAAAQNAPPVVAPAPTNAPPVETYSATAHALVPWGAALVTGGWKTPSGKRALVFAVPKRVEHENRVLANQVQIQAWVVEAPDEAVGRLGLKQFNTDDRFSTAAGLLASDQREAILQAAKDSEGVDVLSAPTLTTVSGRQAQVQVVNVHRTPSGEEYLTGPVIDLIPTISPDGQSVQMDVAAQLHYPVPSPRE